jgi:hypothetical protein
MARSGYQIRWMTALPDGLTLEQDRDLVGRERRPRARQVILTLLAVFLLLALLNLFGQRPSTATARSADATLEVYSPARVRGGLLFEARLHLKALREIKDATVVLDSGWLEGMTLNTIEPSPIGEASRDGRLALDLGHVPAGDDHLLFLQFQVNPTNIGRRPTDIDVYDGDRLLLHVDRTITVWP